MRWPAEFALALAALVQPVDAAEIVAERQGELRHLVLQDCGSCHGMTMKGGLGTALTPGDLASANPSAIAEVILDGIPGTPMPPWRGLISDAEAFWIAEQLKQGRIQ